MYCILGERLLHVYEVYEKMQLQKLIYFLIFCIKQVLRSAGPGETNRVHISRQSDATNFHTLKDIFCFNSCTA